jgi:hypothetical protein
MTCVTAPPFRVPVGVAPATLRFAECHSQDMHPVDHKEQHEFAHKKERERETGQEKRHEQVVAQQEKKGWGAPRPLFLIVIGTGVTLAIVLSWIFAFR